MAFIEIPNAGHSGVAGRSRLETRAGQAAAFQVRDNAGCDMCSTAAALASEA